MNDEARRMFEETEKKIQQAIKQKRKNDIIWFISQHIAAISLGLALYKLFS